jgi:hypothetical protein
MAQHRKPNLPSADPPVRHLADDELFRLMSELVLLREKVAQAELEATHSNPSSAQANSGNEGSC